MSMLFVVVAVAVVRWCRVPGVAYAASEVVACQAAFVKGKDPLVTIFYFYYPLLQAHRTLLLEDSSSKQTSTVITTSVIVETTPFNATLLLASGRSVRI